MPTYPIVDSHVHFWDPGLIRYPWLDDNALLNRVRLPADLAAVRAGIDVEAMVFVQCEADFSAFEDEARWVEKLSEHDEPLIRALVAWAPLEKGAAVASDLERLQRIAILRGIRRIIQFEPDLEFCLRPAFIEGVRTLAAFDLSFDICVDHRHMANLLKFVEQVPDVPMVLDHIGKPAIAAGESHPWADQIRSLSQFPQVMCKISGVATEAVHDAWTPECLKPYIMTAIEAFGFERVMFGGDWPVATQAIDYRTWVRMLDEILTGVSADERSKFWRSNAKAFYRID